MGWNSIAGSLGGMPGLGAGAGGVNPALALGAGLSLADIANQFYWNQKNYNLQSSQYHYQQQLQNLLFMREDNSIQRRVNDLKAAGLSPVLAAGQGAGPGGSVSTTAPQGTPVGISDAVMLAMNMIKMEADVSKTYAENEYIELQKNKIPYDIAESIVRSGNIIANTKLANQNTAKSYSDKKLVDEKTKQEKIRTENAVDAGSTGDSIPGKIVNDVLGNLKKAGSINMFNLPSSSELEKELQKSLDKSKKRR